MPLEAARFGISVDGVQIASFSELQGITTEVRSVEYDEGREDPVRFLNRFARARPPVSIRLARRRTGDARISAWHRAAKVNLLTGRKNCVLAVYGSDNKPVARFYLENAWPSQIRPGTKTSAAGSVAMETIVIAHEGFELN
jgi:phage tail-like protein